MPRSASLRSTPMRDIRLTKRAFSAAGVQEDDAGEALRQQLDRAVDGGRLIHVEEHRCARRRFPIGAGLDQGWRQPA